MAYHNLWGINPKTEKPEAYIGHINSPEREEWEKKAKTEGWTRLTWGKWIDTDPEEEETTNEES